MPRGVPNPPLSLDLIEQYSKRSRNGCLLWTGPVRNGGYAQWKYNGKWVTVHRWLYEAVHGPIGDLTVDHQCHDQARCKKGEQCPHRRCVEITHLLAMTNAENSMRGGGPMAQKARQKKCIRGHSLSGKNLYVTLDGRRQCKRCRKEYMAGYYEEHRETWNKPKGR